MSRPKCVNCICPQCEQPTEAVGLQDSSDTEPRIIWCANGHVTTYGTKTVQIAQGVCWTNGECGIEVLTTF